MTVIRDKSNKGKLLQRGLIRAAIRGRHGFQFRFPSDAIDAIHPADLET